MSIKKIVSKVKQYCAKIAEEQEKEEAEEKEWPQKIKDLREKDMGFALLVTVGALVACSGAGMFYGRGLERASVIKKASQGQSVTDRIRNSTLTPDEVLAGNLPVKVGNGLFLFDTLTMGTGIMLTVVGRRKRNDYKAQFEQSLAKWRAENTRQ